MFANVDDYFDATIGGGCARGHTSVLACTTDQVKRYMSGRWTGACFDPRMDEPWWCDNRINASDLYGVAALSMPRFLGSTMLKAACNMLDLDDQAAFKAGCGPTCTAHVTCILRQVPPRADIWDPGALHYLDLADTLWSWIEKRRPAGIGAVGTSKLISRKRPHLVPILDSISKARMRQRNGGRKPRSYYLYFHSEVSANGATLATQIAGVRAAAGVPPWMSDLRVIDIAIWFENIVGC